MFRTFRTFRTFRWIAAILVSTSVLASAQTKAPTPATTNLTAELTERERQMWVTFGNKDVKGFGALLADNFVYITRYGYTTAPELLELVTQCNQSSFSFHDLRVLPAGNDSAVVLVHVTSPTTCNGNVEAPELYAATTWTKQSGTWKVLVHSEMEIPDEKPAPAAPSPK
jgi:hypothetical protein